jgi:DNA polymerase-3 subunit epsilon/oligoribonuclease
VKAVFVDIETTGLDFDVHVPIDIAVAVLDLNDTSNLVTYTSCITCDAEDWILADPKALEVNGFTQENTRLSKKDWEVGREIEEFLIRHKITKDEAFFICQNPSFDRPFFLQLISQERMNSLNWPYHWLDLASMFWIKFYGCSYPAPTKLSLSKDSIARHFNLPPERKPHRALNGVLHLIQCYRHVTSWQTCFPPGEVQFMNFKAISNLQE